MELGFPPRRRAETVDLKDDPAAAVEQEQEVHPLPGQDSPDPAGVRVVMKVDLRDQRRNVETVTSKCGEARSKLLNIMLIIGA